MGDHDPLQRPQPPQQHQQPPPPAAAHGVLSRRAAILQPLRLLEIPPTYGNLFGLLQLWDTRSDILQ